MEISCPAFENKEMIPKKHTCDGDDVSPELLLSDIPDGTESLALVMDDPDAPMGTFDHWVVWNIPSDTEKIEEGEEPSGVQGKTGFGKKGYGGPCPPSGVHRYFFKLYALEDSLDLREGSSKKDLEQAMDDLIIEKAVLVGKYSR